MIADDEKKRLRRHFARLRSELTVEERAKYDLEIVARVRTLDLYRTCEAIAAYVAFGAEPDLSFLFSEKRLLLPRFVAEKKLYEFVEVTDCATQLRPGKYGILEPLPELPAVDGEFLRCQTLILAPAVACDRQGTRLGRGGGFYDRLLDRAEFTAAVVYSCQIADALPRQTHDIPVSRVVSEREIVFCP